MQGPSVENTTPERDVGLIPRAFAQIFDNIETMKADGWTHSIDVKV